MVKRIVVKEEAHRVDAFGSEKYGDKISGLFPEGTRPARNDFDFAAKLHRGKLLVTHGFNDPTDNVQSDARISVKDSQGRTVDVYLNHRGDPVVNVHHDTRKTIGETVDVVAALKRAKGALKPTLPYDNAALATIELALRKLNPQTRK